MWKAFASVVVSLGLGVAFARIGAAQDVLLGIPALGASQGLTGDPDKVPVPPTPRSVQRILVAQPFTVQTPFINDWSKERGQFTSGTLVVLEIDGAYLVPRNATAGPVLYAGDTPVLRLNHGHLSGRVIGIVPGTVDLTTVPLWFGSPEIADAKTPATALAERRRTEQAAMTPLPADQILAARRAPVSAKDLAVLLRTTAAELVLQYSPQEEALAEIWRLPTAKPPPARRYNIDARQGADQERREFRWLSSIAAGPGSTCSPCACCRGSRSRKPRARSWQPVP